MTVTNEYIPLFISGLVFLSIFFFFVVLFSLLRQRAKRRELAGRIYQESTDTRAKEETAAPSRMKNKLQDRILDFFNSVGNRVIPKMSSDYGEMRPKFLKAGLRSERARTAFWGMKCFLVVCLPVCFLVLPVALFKPLNPQLTIAACAFLACLGFFLPDIWLQRRIVKRKEKLFEGFPDALDLLAVCVEAGMGLDAATVRVAEEIKLTNKPLSDELKLLNLELRAGKARRDALRDLAMRTDLEDIRNLTTLLIQTDKFGGSITKALRVYSDTFRTKRYQRAEETAAKIPVKLTFPLALFIFPSLFVVILGPAAIRIYETIIQR